MVNKLWLLVSFIAIGVSLYYTAEYPEYFWMNFILIATSIIFGVCFEKNRERQGEEAQTPPPLPKAPGEIPEEFRIEQKLPIR